MKGNYSSRSHSLSCHGAVAKVEETSLFTVVIRFASCAVQEKVLRTYGLSLPGKEEWRLFARRKEGSSSCVIF